MDEGGEITTMQALDLSGRHVGRRVIVKVLGRSLSGILTGVSHGGMRSTDDAGNAIGKWSLDPSWRTTVAVDDDSGAGMLDWKLKPDEWIYIELPPTPEV